MNVGDDLFRSQYVNWAKFTFFVGSNALEMDSQWSPKYFECPIKYCSVGSGTLVNPFSTNVRQIRKWFSFSSLNVTEGVYRSDRIRLWSVTLARKSNDPNNWYNINKWFSYVRKTESTRYLVNLINCRNKLIRIW